MEQAFVLHRWPYQEHALLLDLLLSNDTRIRAIAKYARSSRSRHRGAFEPFQMLDIELIGRGELKTVRHVDVIKRHLLVADRVYSGLYVNELTQRLLREHIHAEGIFTAYANTLSLLAADVDQNAVLRRFEWQLLQSLELLDSFSHEAAAGEPIQPDICYRYEPGIGFLVAGPSERLDQQIPGALILQMANFAIEDSKVMQQFRAILRRALSPHLGDKPLKSRELLLASRGSRAKHIEED